MAKKEDTYDKIERTLYRDSTDEMVLMLNDREKQIRQRMLLCVSKRMDDPLVEDSKLVEFLMNGCGGLADRVSQSQAYRDIGMINRLLGNISLAAKNWYRYIIVEGAKKAYNLAIDRGDAKGAAAALDKIGKYTQCDRDDNKFDFSKMIPPSFEPSDDITLLEGIEPIDNLEQKRKELRESMGGLLKSRAEDIEYAEEEE